jgi:hypothetical protein
VHIVILLSLKKHHLRSIKNLLHGSNCDVFI